jgi:hypothetical protein
MEEIAFNIIAKIFDIEKNTGILFLHVCIAIIIFLFPYR